MTPRMSVRARAREIYGEMAPLSQSFSGASPSPLRASAHSSPYGERSLAYGGGEKKARVSCGGDASSDLTSDTPLPNPPPQGGREQTEQAARAEPNLTARIRNLCETSAVPVREVARMTGVTERTLYKYVQKGDWKRRYRCLERDEAVAAANRGRRWEVSPARAGDPAIDVTPAKGAGGRFIRREDIGKPFPTGLKALDPAGRGRALKVCRKAQRLSRVAQAKASVESWFEARLRAIDATHRAVSAYNDFRRDFAARGATGPKLRPPNPNEWPRKEAAKTKQHKKTVLPASLFASIEWAHIRAIDAALRGWLEA